MARYSRLQTLTVMKEIGLVPVFYNPNSETACRIIDACAEGGARVVEFTNRGDRAINVFNKLTEYRDSKRPEVILGVGSICDAPTAAMYIAAGADFIVGPLLDEETAKLCNKRKIPYCPGCGSVTEIHKAHELGVEICKIFPGGQVGGAAFAKAVKGPCPWAELMPTGGISPTPESLKEWFDAGIACAGMGSKLITKELVAAGDFAGITRKVQDTLTLIRQIRFVK
ncbi:MAG TPA: bifunctional 4-hydroxy-2-oxoglutarate aldolase/2-dehydro-3-deoxy-phosphogluconate aldolase [Anaerohalosphaeraceae bacterium]|nr:bifunctional 4-hydroxy-2-oxoglutarate aldolase/2-dehydro-3-deoxy-phosphogluconate aldolase [Anaerohalosphaeraceae bacterium]HOM75212.1 bifunctional 4-hydroxy-2-oxoglutarate aldolase/2-dehydro-3-deoxy-phosphogluconate aldolase [Anaerohalosphaeraceae bacterium]HPC63994.1 bifunctional 4-hydroxy-2-oxoglutarate aldolase/2-dehydro-3-deoxy-phosphogluconate aldolase [Anaerohalosphaeraceae bacterium]HPO69965.1 bifunctional 4-hydroxy-2-oxoglutarate aldolase/2-dehydro-3-deoxy-phosphogluconate aldolase [